MTRPDSMRGDLSLFAATPPGLEPVTERELASLGVANAKCVPGGVEFRGDLRTLYTANLWLRSAGRILVRIESFFVVHLAKLRKKLDQVPFERYLVGSMPISVRATCRKSRIYHSTAAAERAALAIQDRLGLSETPRYGEGSPSTAAEGTTVILRIERDHCTVSIDSSGDHLHRRGYRIHQHEAPLRENLAAAMLLLMGYDGGNPLWDPMCGSGTFPIEAALIAANIPPGRHRRFSFMAWPNFDETLFLRLIDDADGRRKTPRMLVGGSDISPEAVSMSASHAVSAGVSEAVRFKITPVADLSLSQATGILMTNPPYGKRLGERTHLHPLYHALGALQVRLSDGWRLGLVAPDHRLASATGLDMRPVGSPFPNGGLRVSLYTTVA